MATGGQVKDPAGFFVQAAPGLSLAHGGRDIFQIDFLQGERGAGRNELAKFAVFHGQSRPQKVVTVDDRANGFMQSRGVQRPWR